ncbi:MAG TPA: HlyD family efflux transporter periplasmic adaptor subunit, partial [Pirellulales bacterium]
WNSSQYGASPVTIRLLGILLAALTLGGLLLYSQSLAPPPKVSGFVEADEIRLGSRVGGRVTRVHVEEGQAVKRGDVLIELEPFDLVQRLAQAKADMAARKQEVERTKEGYRKEEIAQAAARLAQAKARSAKLTAGSRPEDVEAARSRQRLALATLDLAKIAQTRVRQAFEKNAKTQQELDEAITAVTVAEQELQVRDQELALMEQGARQEDRDEAAAAVEEAAQAHEFYVNGYRAEEKAEAQAAYEAAEAAVSVIEQQLKELTIRAPSDGVIEAVDLQPGDLVGANTPAVTMIDSQRMWLRAYIPENRMSLKVEQLVTVTLDSFPNETFPAKVTFVSRQAEFTPGNVQTIEERSKQVFRIKVEFQTAKDRIRAGMIGDVWLDKKPPNEVWPDSRSAAPAGSVAP